MKTLLLAVLITLATGCHDASRFEFHTGPDGLVLYRCDRITGQTWYTVPLQRAGWIEVPNNIVFTPPPVDSDTTAPHKRDVFDLTPSQAQPHRMKVDPTMTNLDFDPLGVPQTGIPK